MAKVFSECGAEEYSLLDSLIRRYRDDLAAAKARVTLLFAADEDGGPALLHHGQQVAGMAKVNSYRDKVEGKADATITLDEDSWRGRTERQRRALLHHELSHVGWERGKYDPLGRPKLHSVHGDWENDGFYEICRIYGEDAPERRYLEGVRERLRQIGLPLADGETGDGDGNAPGSV
jgi:hypothetical protein